MLEQENPYHSSLHLLTSRSSQPQTKVLKYLIALQMLYTTKYSISISATTLSVYLYTILVVRTTMKTYNIITTYKNTQITLKDHEKRDKTFWLLCIIE